MRSIYSLMQESEQRDEIIRDNYPDVLTMPLQDFSFDAPPRQYDLEQRDVIRPDLLMQRQYSIAELDDLLFFINGIGLVSEEELGRSMLLPTKKTIERFFNRNFS